uniref:WD repeat-containing protein 44 n=1 Tax=Globodera pallida TaxID=36090 RepID=A0A183BSH4_GLOPA
MPTKRGDETTSSDGTDELFEDAVDTLPQIGDAARSALSGQCSKSVKTPPAGPPPPLPFHLTSSVTASSSAHELASSSSPTNYLPSMLLSSPTSPVPPPLPPRRPLPNAANNNNCINDKDALCCSPLPPNQSMSTAPLMVVAQPVTSYSNDSDNGAFANTVNINNELLMVVPASESMTTASSDTAAESSSSSLAITAMAGTAIPTHTTSKESQKSDGSDQQQQSLFGRQRGHAKTNSLDRGLSLAKSMKTGPFPPPVAGSKSNSLTRGTSPIETLPILDEQDQSASTVIQSVIQQVLSENNSLAEEDEEEDEQQNENNAQEEENDAGREDQEIPMVASSSNVAVHYENLADSSLSPPPRPPQPCQRDESPTPILRPKFAVNTTPNNNDNNSGASPKHMPSRSSKSEVSSTRKQQQQKMLQLTDVKKFHRRSASDRSPAKLDKSAKAHKPTHQKSSTWEPHQAQQHKLLLSGEQQQMQQLDVMDPITRDVERRMSLKAKEAGAKAAKSTSSDTNNDSADDDDDVFGSHHHRHTGLDHVRRFARSYGAGAFDFLRGAIADSDIDQLSIAAAASEPNAAATTAPSTSAAVVRKWRFGSADPPRAATPSVSAPTTSAAATSSSQGFGILAWTWYHQKLDKSAKAHKPTHQKSSTWEPHQAQQHKLLLSGEQQQMQQLDVMDPITRDVERRMSLKAKEAGAKAAKSTSSDTNNDSADDDDDVFGSHHHRHTGLDHVRRFARSYGAGAFDFLRGAVRKAKQLPEHLSRNVSMSRATKKSEIIAGENEDGASSIADSDIDQLSIAAAASEPNAAATTAPSTSAAVVRKWRFGSADPPRAATPSVSAPTTSAAATSSSQGMNSSAASAAAPFARTGVCRPKNAKKGPFDFEHLALVQEMNNEHTGAVWCVKFSDCGRLLATAGQDRNVRVWVLQSQLKHFALSPESEAHSASSSPSFDSSVASVHVPSTGNEQQQQPSNSSNQSSPSKLSAASAVFAPKPLCVFRGHTADVLDLSWSPRNYFLLSSGMDRTAKLWHLNRNECLCSFQHIDFVTCLAFMPKDDRYFISGSLDGKIRLWHIPEKKVAIWNEVEQVNKFITAMTFVKNGKFVVIGTFLGRCFFYSTDQLKYHTVIDVRSSRGKNSVGHKITSLAVHGDKLLVASDDSRIRIYDLRDMDLCCKFKGAQISQSLIRAAFSPDGSHVVSGSEDAHIYLWRTGSLPSSLGVRKDRNHAWERVRAHQSAVISAVFAPKPQLILKWLADQQQKLSSSSPPALSMFHPPSPSNHHLPPLQHHANTSMNNGTASSSASLMMLFPNSSLPSAPSQSAPGGVASGSGKTTNSRSMLQGGDVVISADLTGSLKAERFVVFFKFEGDGKTEPADADNRPKDRNRFDYNSETLKELGFDAFPYYIERAWWKEGYRMTFWSHWDMLRDIKRRRTVAEWGPLRMRYKALKTNNILPQAIINEFQERMNKMPRRANPNLVIQMCQFTARRRGKLNKFRLNRHIFRQITDRGELSGTQRASCEMLRFSAIALLLLLSVMGAFCADQSSDGAQSEGAKQAQERLKKAREGLNVHMFSSQNYAPMFGIIAGLSVVLIVAVVFIVVGLFSMEPEKFGR